MPLVSKRDSIMSKPMALLVFKFLRLKKSFLFRYLPEDKRIRVSSTTYGEDARVSIAFFIIASSSSVIVNKTKVTY